MPFFLTNYSDLLLHINSTRFLEEMEPLVVTGCREKTVKSHHAIPLPLVTALFFCLNVSAVSVRGHSLIGLFYPFTLTTTRQLRSHNRTTNFSPPSTFFSQERPGEICFSHFKSERFDHPLSPPGASGAQGAKGDKGNVGDRSSPKPLK